jgi:hypothetical protein
MKTCTTCNQKKAISDFYTSVSHSDGRQARCKSCQNEKRDFNTFKKDHPDLTESEFYHMYFLQLGRCGACEEKIEVKDVHIDHDHSHCGKKRSCKNCRRGLLCRSCNLSLGIMREESDRIHKLAQYAEKWTRN